MSVLTKLPINFDFNNPKIIKKLIEAHKALAELKWTAKLIPNENILINSLALQEAKDSSEIENIITTHDELYISSIDKNYFSKETKEVQNYKNALINGFQLVKENKLLLIRHILEIQETLENNSAWIRTQAGTVLKNDKTWKIIYTPPQTKDEIEKLLKNLEDYINSDLDQNDPLIKMAIIHHQFESIHPFYDGNGRTWRIINILFLVLNNLLDLPILYLSWYIIKHKSDYYRLLQEARTKWNWDEWILYILEAVEKTSLETIYKINGINALIKKSKIEIREKLPKIYSKDLIEILFSHPYTKIEFLVEWMLISRQRASRYLDELVENWFLEVIQIKNSKYFINLELFELLKAWYNYE